MRIGRGSRSDNFQYPFLDCWYFDDAVSRGFFVNQTAARIVPKLHDLVVGLLFLAPFCRFNPQDAE